MSLQTFFYSLKEILRLEKGFGDDFATQKFKYIYIYGFFPLVEKDCVT